MTERQTKRVQLPSGHSIDVLTFITIGEAEEIQLIAQENIIMEQGPDKQPIVRGISFKGMQASTNRAKELCIKAVYDEKGNKVEPFNLETIQNLPAQDADGIKEAIDALTAKKKSTP